MFQTQKTIISINKIFLLEFFRYFKIQRDCNKEVAKFATILS